MPLTPATTDKFQKVGLPGSATTLSSPGFTAGNTSITVGATTNHPTDTLYTFAIDRAQTVNGVTSRIAGTYCEFEGIVTGATTIGSVVLKNGTSQNYPAGSFTRVYIPVSSNRENALIDGLNQDHNGKGNHKNLTDDNGNTWLTRSQVASAVNNVQVSNAIAGKDPSLKATGSDTNVNLQLDGKGTGLAVARNPELVSNFVASGGIWSGLGYGTTLTAAMTAAVCYINGRRIVLAAIATRTYTASKDTYVDVLDNLDGTGTVVYTEVANGAASPALAANSMRIAKVVSAATITAATSIIQGGVDTVTTSGQLNYIYNTSPTAAPVFTYVNGGSGGGTFYYRNQSGVKEVWGVINSVSVAASGYSGNMSINLPPNFFNAIQSANASSYGSGSNQGPLTMAVQGISTTSILVILYNTGAGTNSTQVAVYIRGV